PLRSAGDLRRQVAATRPPTSLRLSVLREGSLLDFSALVEKRPPLPAALPGEREWGIRPVCRHASDAHRSEGLEGDDGVVIERVHPGASLAGLHSGDVIREVDGVRVRNLSDFCREVRRWTSSGRPGAQLTVQSQGTGTLAEIHVTGISR